MKALSSLAIFASLSVIGLQNASAGSVQLAIWNCVAIDPNGTVSSLTAEQNFSAGMLTGSLIDGHMSSAPVPLASSSFKASKLGGGIHGHDSRDYEVELVADSEDDFSSSNDSTFAHGKAAVKYDGFIDCIGDESGLELLSCNIELIRGN